MPRPLRMATRGSELARWQAAPRRRAARRRRRAGGRVDHRRPAHRRAHPRDRRHRRVREGGAAGGARRPRRPRGALGQGPARPTTPTGSCSRRSPSAADPRDALVGLDARRAARRRRGSRTGSVRRRAQLAALRPDLTFAELRGNIATRLAQARADFDAVVVAAAALERLGLDDRRRPRCSTRR